MSRYAEAFKHPNGPGDARPTAMQVVQDEGLVGKLTDKVFLVTGVSSGIGIETMRALYATGGHVFGTVRNMDKGRKVVEQVKSETTGGQITLIEMDNESLASVKKAADSFLQQSKTLNILICNAGVMATPEGKTKDGFETQLGVNYIAHFYLFQLVKDALLATATPSFPSRVVVVSSIGHRVGSVRFNDFNFEKEPYNTWLAYGQAKTAEIWFSNEIERRYGSRNLHSTSLHPGGVHSGLQTHIEDMMEASKDDPEIKPYMKNAAQGAATSIYAALDDEWKNKGGKFLSDCVEQGPVKSKDNPMIMSDNGYQDWAYAKDDEERLWTDTLKRLGLKDDQ